jgi:cytochrome c oxidase cbb3-type subunit 4
MELYSLLREIADSWVLLGMTLIFVGICLWVFRPSAERLHSDAAASIFRNEDRPADPSGPVSTSGRNWKEA